MHYKNPPVKKYKPEFLASSDVNGNKVCLYRTYNGNRSYYYHIHWGQAPQSKIEMLTPKGNRRNLGGSIKEFFQAVEAAKQVTFSKL